MRIKEIPEAISNMNKDPINENELFVILSSANLISAGAKLGCTDKRSAYSIIKPEITRLLTYSFNHSELRLYDSLYYDIKEKCAYIQCLGLQFSYHQITETDEIMVFAHSDKNKVVEFEAIYKQPKALGLYHLAVDCLNRNISDPEVIAKKFDELPMDFPQLMVRHLGEMANKGTEEVSLESILSAKFKISKQKK